ncbi:MAG TPA: sigma-70 family RNA polymerase sigma factor, partial [Membranihabitans sp.]|nr:sigma-70 family RNA polymerase sigma factor [Membranihabitans sp.]
YSKEYAEDVVADVFREFWQKKQFNKVTTSFRTYLFRAVRNRAMNMIRRELRQTNPLSEDWDAVSETLRPDEQMIYDQFYQKIQSCIDQLPPMCRKVFLMSRYEGKSLREIADFHEISIRTVEAHISKALGVLRTTLKNEN